MTLDEAIKHCEEVAENYRYQREDAVDINDVGAASYCQQCADDHEQLADWLRELKELRNSIGAVKLKDMKEANAIIRTCNRVLGYILEYEIDDTSTKYEVQALLNCITDYLSGGSEK